MSQDPKIPNLLTDTYETFSINAVKGDRGRPSGGLLFGWKKLMKGEVTITKQTMFYVILNLSKFKLIFTYVSPNLGYENCISELEEEIKILINQNQKILVMGDLNGRIGSFSPAEDTRNSKDKITNKRGRRLMEMISSSGLTIGNGLLDGDLEGELTCVKREGGSVVDLLLYDDRLSDVIDKFTVQTWTHSDHFPIILKLNTLTHEPSLLKTGKPRIRVPVAIEEVQNLAKQMEIALESAPPGDTAETLNTLLHNQIISVCEAEGYYKSPKPPSLKPEWFDKECTNEKFRLTQLVRKFRRTRNPLSLSSYVDAQQNFKALTSRKQEEYNLRLEKRLHNHRNSQAFWSALKLKIPVTGNHIPPITWHAHFSKVFTATHTQDPTNPAQPTTEPMDPTLDAPVNVFEIKLATKNLKSHKAPGTDEIPNEIWKLRSPQLLLNLCTIFQLCQQSLQIPNKWCEATITPVHKKGSKEDPANYRPISLLNTILKLFSTILNTRLTAWIRKRSILSEFQAGFQKGRSTEDHIFTLMALIQLRLQKKKKLYACFIDVSQAFDSPAHPNLWKTLLGYGISSRFVALYESLYSKATATVKSSHGPSEPIKIQRGVLQGEPASPNFFNLFMEDIITMLNKAWVAGIQVMNTIVHILMYADDTTLLAPSAETLQIKIDMTAKSLNEKGLSINLKKTKVVIFQNGGGRRKKAEAFLWN